MYLQNTIFIILLLLSSCKTYAKNECFVAIEKGNVVKQIGKCDARYSPFSTFKVPVALMAFDAGIFKSPNTPQFEFTEHARKRIGEFYNPQKYPTMLWYELPQTPYTFMNYSVIWVSQEITEKLGMEKFNSYVHMLNYGNMNVSGNPKKNDGLTSAWLDSSLKISPLEQVKFIEKLTNKQLPLKQDAQENTMRIMKLEDLNDGWKLYGKTGGGKTGWFIGWVEKENRRIIFAQYSEPENNPLPSAGRISKELAKDNLIPLMCKECITNFEQFNNL